MKIRRQAFCLLVLGVLIWFLMDAQSVRSAALEALELCAASVIPALFPFLVVSTLLLKLGFGEALSPWLAGFEVGDLHTIAVSHGEGKFVVSRKLAEELFANGQVAFQYADEAGEPTGKAPFNPNGSYYGIEGIVSRDGQILGKMGHTERYERNLYRNIAGEKTQDLFGNAVRSSRICGRPCGILSFRIHCRISAASCIQE